MRLPRIAVIGAGIAGLSFARAIGGRAGVTLFDKSRGVSGRMATRRHGELDFDHGAQFFTAREPRFRAAVDAALADGAVHVWDAPLHRIAADGSMTIDERAEPRYVGRPAMTSLARHWARDLDVRTGAHVTGVKPAGALWTIVTEDQVATGPFDWVVSTAPAPQARALLPLSPDDGERLGSVRIQGCFTLMLVPSQPLTLPFAAARVDDPVIGWIAANNSKPGRGDVQALVVHAANAWSDAQIEDAPAVVEAAMLSALRPLIPDLGNRSLDHKALHRWRHANVVVPLGAPYILDRARGLAACGDWCLGNRVEAAFMSGALLADQLSGDPQRPGVDNRA